MSENLDVIGQPLLSPEVGQPEAPQAAETQVPEKPAEAMPAETPMAEGTQNTGMTDMFSDEYAYLQPKRGEIRQAQVIAIHEDGMMVDLGLKREGLVPAYDLQRIGNDVVQTVSVGDEIPVYVVRPEDRDGNIIVSWCRARQEQDWLDAEKLLESGEVWEGIVKGYNRGGLIVPYGKIRGFVPASHVTGISRRMNQTALQARLSEMVEETVPLKALEVDRQNRRLIFSERVARREWRTQKRELLLNELQEGAQVHGTVSNVCDFGVFVDIGGTDGLVHISELSWRRANHPSELLKVGDEVDAYVLRVDREHKRIGLSLKQLEPDPWNDAEQRYHVGQLVTGVITKLTDFGVFAVLEDGIEGLVHISELAEIPPKQPSEVVAKGATLPLLVVKVDGDRRRMGLSLRRVSEEEWYEWEEARREAAQEAQAEQQALAGEPEQEVSSEEPVQEAVTAEPEAQVAEVTTALAQDSQAPEMESSEEAQMAVLVEEEGTQLP